LVTEIFQVMKNLFLAILLMPFLAYSQQEIDNLKDSLAIKSSQIDRITILNRLGHLVRFSSMEKAMLYSKEALNLSKKEQYSIGEIDAYITIGLIYWLQSLPEKGLESGLLAMRLSDSISYKKGIMEANLLLGSVYKDLDDVKKADAYTNAGLAVAQELNDDVGIARAYNGLGNYERKRKDEEHAFFYYQLALSSLKGNDLDRLNIKILVLNNIAIYYLKNDLAKAKKCLNEALDISIDTKLSVAELFTRFRLSDFHKKVGDFKKAHEQLVIAEMLSVELGIPNVRSKIYESIAECLKRLGQNDLAHVYEVKYIELYDSLLDLQNARHIAELEAKHKTEIDNQKLRLLQQERKIQLIWQSVLIGGLVMVVVSGFFIYKLQRSRIQKTKKLVEIQHLLNIKLKEVDKLKTRFFANISHEFRTPLTLILAPLENELRRKISGEGRESLLIVKRNANRLLELVNQLLDLSKLESGKMELRIKQGDLKQFFFVLAASFESLSENKQISFVKKIQVANQPYWYDQDKLEKITTNILANAFKFTPAGGAVTLTVNSSDDSTVSIQITDTGTGISKEEQAAVFSPFYQTKQAVESLQQGTGLGLSLVRELVKLHCGSISLESAPGVGTTLHVIIPINKKFYPNEQIVDDGIPLLVSKNNSASKSEVALDHEKIETALDSKDSILIVEDNADLREFMSATLHRNNFAVFTACDGEEAVPLALKFIPSLILTDLMMPKVDGIEFARKIKNDERTSHIPVILLTAKNEFQSRIDGLKTGADDYLTKPFSPDELIVRIKNLIRQRKMLVVKFRERILTSSSTPDESSLDESFLQKLRLIVESNMGDYAFSVEKMADEMNLSRTQLLRKLKALTGLSPNDFIKDLRLKRASEMILQKADTITQIGYAVGFNDQSYFTKCFKKQFGVTPSEYSL
jgi:signal transduction histidine kinase/DNA-binding response OmpR family regulator